MSLQRTLSAACSGGLAVFILIVAYLHWHQADYDPRTQLMSELALGPRGGLMLPAFLGLAGAMVALAARLRHFRAPAALVISLTAAAASIAAAGLITLTSSAEAHIVFVATAFVLCGLAMYLLPQQVAKLATPSIRLASWICCFITAGATALGGSYLASGIAQRMAALTLFSWLLFINWRLSR